jgi:hypothetical protein
MSLRKIWVDARHDRIYLASRDRTPGGFNVLAIDGFSALPAAIADPDAASAMRIELGSAMFVMVDSQDRLYALDDSARQVRIWYNAGSLTGTVTTPPDRTIYGAVHSAYGMDFEPY